jgi:hypothetical protein
MSKAEDPSVKESEKEDFTKITFQPDLSKFKMEKLDDDTVALMARRVYDIAACSPGVEVFLNDKKLPINKFEDYVKLYIGDKDVDEMDNPLNILYDKPGPRWEIAVACSDIGFQQVSFVNSIATTKGGRHVDYIVDQIAKYLVEFVNKNYIINVKPHQIKGYMWVFVNCRIENPTFDSPTKENMTLQVESFSSTCKLNDEFVKKLSKGGLHVKKFLKSYPFQDQTYLEKAGPKSKRTIIIKISSDSDVYSDNSSIEENDIDLVPISRSPRARRAKKPASYKLDSGDEVVIVDSTTDDDSYVSETVSQAKSFKASKPHAEYLPDPTDSSSDATDDDDDFKSKKSEAKKPTKKKLLPKDQVLSDDDETFANKRKKKNPIDDGVFICNRLNMQCNRIN